MHMGSTLIKMNNRITNVFFTKFFSKIILRRFKIFAGISRR